MGNVGLNIPGGVPSGTATSPEEAKTAFREAWTRFKAGIELAGRTNEELLQSGVRFLSMPTKPSPRVRDREPGIYVVENDNRAIVALEATCLAEARHLIKERWFQIRVTKQTTNGIPVWDGKAKLRIRPATEVEVEALGETHGDFTLTFLVDLDGSPTDSGRPVEPGAFPPQRG